LGITLGILILCQVINNASHANRIVKINLLQLSNQNALTIEVLALADFVKKPTRLYKEIEWADLDNVGEKRQK
jgi:hypothetical protein